MDNNKNTSLFSRSVLPWFMFSVAALFYCYAYFLRVSPGVMMADLMANFEISAAAFGSLSAFYYYAYSPMQLPAGVIIDKYGARAVLFFACLLTVLGVSIFASADNYMLAATGRFLIGFGSAFSYITALKIASVWLPANRFATAAGLTTSFGKLAAIFSGTYLGSIIENVGYKTALHSSIIAGIILAVFILLAIRSRPKHLAAHPEDTMSYKELFLRIGTLFKRKQTWVIGIVGALLYLPASVFMDLWGIPFLENKYEMTHKQAVYGVSMLFFGWLISSPFIGALSDRIQRRKLPLLVASFCAAILFSMVFYYPELSIRTVFILLFFTGIFCGSHPLCFSLSKENSPIKLSGTATAVTNFLIMSGGVIFQPVVGIFLDLLWDGRIENGIPYYTNQDYNLALSVIPIGLIVAGFLCLTLKETGCKQITEE